MDKFDAVCAGPCRRAAAALRAGADYHTEGSTRIPEHLTWLGSLRNRLQAEHGEAFDLNCNSIDSLIVQLGRPSVDVVPVGEIGQSHTTFPIFLAADGEVLGCLALPRTLPRRC